jgi:hypothetical protein
MGTTVIPFPPRRRSPSILICRERDGGGGWLVIAGSHGWLHGSLLDAALEAAWLARDLDLPIRGGRA